MSARFASDPAVSYAEPRIAAPDRSRVDPAVLGRQARAALLAELHADPKPGLVGPHDSGSHADMDRSHFERSAAALEPFFARLAALGAEGAPMDALRRVGLEAEAAMLVATGGVNTHRGAIFGLGLLCAAAGLAHRGPALGTVVAGVWGPAILAGPIPLRSNGTGVMLRHGVGGARAEAAVGFPALYRVGLPALRAGRALRPDDPVAARVQCLFSLVAAVDDTNLLHRGGVAGAAFARSAARSFLDPGGVADPDWRERALGIHRAFVARRLSPGGCADLLAMTMFVDAIETPSTPSGQG